MENKTQDVGQTRPRRWGSAGWAVAAHRDGRWLILPGRYETEAGAKLTAEFAALGGKVLVVEVSAGPDLAQRSEAEEPSEAVRCSELLERLRVIHMGALAALAEAVGTDRLHRIIGPEIGADLVRAGMLSRYEELGPTDEDGESFIVYELTAVGAAAGLAWGRAMRHGRSNSV